jgi:hypothetical protein
MVRVNSGHPENPGQRVQCTVRDADRALHLLYYNLLGLRIHTAV